MEWDTARQDEIPDSENETSHANVAYRIEQRLRRVFAEPTKTSTLKPGPPTSANELTATNHYDHDSDDSSVDYYSPWAFLDDGDALPPDGNSNNASLTATASRPDRSNAAHDLWDDEFELYRDL